MMELFNFWNTFFHGRVGDNVCRLGGYLRIGFGIIFLVDRLVLGLDFDDFFSPSHGFLPLEVGRDNPNLDETMWSLLELYPESDQFLWTLFWIGIAQGVMLVLGILPRFQAACLFVNIVSLQNHNFLFWNRQDALFRIWCFFLLFLPLHRITIFDIVPEGTKSLQGKRKQESWPLWPFRLFQIQLAVMYMGLSLNKLENENWRSGDALFQIKENNYINGGWIQIPETFCNSTLGPKLVTWLTMGIEISCWITLWIPALRIPTAICMIVFNFAVDLTMSFHCLPWLAILGWCATCFNDRQKDKPSATQHQSPELLVLTNIFLVILLIFLSADALPIPSFERLILGKASMLSTLQESLYETIEPTLCIFALWQEIWNLYEGHRQLRGHSVSFSADLYVDDGRVGEPRLHSEVWESPRFHEMTGLQRKRYGRQLVYWSNLDNRIERHAWLSLADQLVARANARSYGEKGTVVGVELKAHWREPWNGETPARDESAAVLSWTSLLKSRLCTDIMPIGHMSYKSTPTKDFCFDCVSESNFVNRYCQSQCEVCQHHQTEFGYDVSCPAKPEDVNIGLRAHFSPFPQYLSYPMSAYIDDEDCEDEEDWDEDDCPYYVYYRDFDPSKPLILTEEKEQEEDDETAEQEEELDEGDDESLETRTASNAQKQIQLVLLRKEPHNQTSLVESEQLKQTILKSK